MKIRPANADDVLPLLMMGSGFVREVYGPDAPTNPGVLAATMQRLIANTSAFFVVALDDDKTVVGTLAGIVAEHPLTGVRNATELFWWMQPEHRGHGKALLETFEMWAAVQGAAAVQMIAPNDRVGKLYQRRKYKPLETVYQRAV